MGVRSAALRRHGGIEIAQTGGNGTLGTQDQEGAPDHGLAQGNLHRQRVGGALQPVALGDRLRIGAVLDPVRLVVDHGQAVGRLDQQVDEPLEHPRPDRHPDVHLAPVPSARHGLTDEVGIQRGADPSLHLSLAPGDTLGHGLTPAEGVQVVAGGQVDDLQHPVHGAPDCGPGPTTALSRSRLPTFERLFDRAAIGAARRRILVLPLQTLHARRGNGPRHGGACQQHDLARVQMPPAAQSCLPQASAAQRCATTPAPPTVTAGRVPTRHPTDRHIVRTAPPVGWPCWWRRSSRCRLTTSTSCARVAATYRRRCCSKRSMSRS